MTIRVEHVEQTDSIYFVRSDGATLAFRPNSDGVCLIQGQQPYRFLFVFPHECYLTADDVSTLQTVLSDFFRNK